MDHLWMAYTQWNDLAAEGGPVVLVRGEGCWLWDVEGRRYLDGVGALEACIIGHGRQELAEAIGRQLEALEFLDVFRYASEPAIRLATRIAALAPGDLNRVFFVTSGSEAVEAAIKMARQYHVLQGEPYRIKVIARRGTYHGCTFGAMAVDGNYWATKKHFFEPLPSFGRFVLDPLSVEELANLIEFERPETVAAVLLDPAGTASGLAVPPPDYLPAIRRLCNYYGILLICDEVITGFGRTGQMFCCQHWDVLPDIMTLSKGITSGYQPMGAVVVREPVFQAFVGGWRETFAHGHTFGGHPVACAAALVNIDIIEREALVNRAAEMGRYLLDGLNTLHARRCFGWARGIGLLCGVKLKRDGKAGQTFVNPAVAGRRARVIARELGLMTIVLHPGDLLLFAPPLIIGREEVDFLVETMDRALATLEREKLE
ncbi:MAG: aspartate aminotransferase family protein [Chloroflexota bacterium]